MSASTPPEITPIEREQRLYERVADKILTLIEDGAWRPGDRLPPERELAQGFGVSRTVVREAVKVLEARGILESITGSGVYVRGPDSSLVSQSLQTYLQLLPDENTEFKIAEIRRVLEGEIAALAALRATPEQRRELQTIYAEMQHYAGSARTLADLDFRFHLALAHATHNDLFSVLLTPLMEQLREYFLVNWDNYGGPLEPVFEQHKAILDAVCSGDAEGARRAMIEHLAFSEKLMRERVAEKARTRA
ncbi:MAG: FadR family transcriptional regulator [Caldilineae bacterium]|nr:MAG: FadR family transcriptional regulator [Caldilineae bacterium]